ncbi:DsbA family protein [Natronosalvus vescus]|uniref:DsbA family protein n=1 Tax=Natronosalvus vescus TaxID=2953881 RepID=UPI0020912AFA|nr:thioredoxin domain-containing protein [Natronosalvus vescus]
MSLTRRRFAALTAGTTLGLAGCLGGDDSGGNGNGDGDGIDEDALLEIPVAGDPDADVTVTVFEDFGCGGCAQYKTRMFPDIEEAYIEPGQIRYEHRDFPIPVQEPWSEAVASAARSVHEHEGDDAFFAFTNEIYTYHGQYSYEVIEEVATDLGFDGEQVRTDAEEISYKEGLEAERAYGERQGVEGTPWVIVDGDRVETSVPSIVAAIDEALADGD